MQYVVRLQAHYQKIHTIKNCSTNNNLHVYISKQQVYNNYVSLQNNQPIIIRSTHSIKHFYNRFGSIYSTYSYFVLFTEGCSNTQYAPVDGALHIQ